MACQEIVVNLFFFVFRQGTCGCIFTNRVWYKFKIYGCCWLYDCDFKLPMKVEHTFFVLLLYSGTLSITLYIPMAVVSKCCP